MEESRPPSVYMEYKLGDKLLTQDSQTGDRPERSCRGYRKNRGRRIAIIIAFLGAMAIMFVGGWFGGMHYQVSKDNDDAASTSQATLPARTQKYLKISAASGVNTTIPVLQGAVPVTDFIKCNYADGNVCQSTNPLLTPKGSTLITPYEFNGQTYLVITVTGSNYGENRTSVPSTVATPTTSSNRKRRDTDMDVAQYERLLAWSDCDGHRIEPGSSQYNTFMKMKAVRATEQENMIFEYTQHRSDTSIFLPAVEQPYLPPGFKKDQLQVCKVLATQGTQALTHLQDYKFFVADHNGQAPWSDDYNSQDGQIGLGPFPAQDNDDGEVLPDDFAPIQIEDSPLADDVSVGEFDIPFPARKRRTATGTATGKPRGVVFKMLDAHSKVPQASFSVWLDPLHGGENGTVRYEVTNHTSKCRSRFSMMYHEALSDGSKLVDASRQQTFVFSHKNQDSRFKVSAWQSITPFSTDAAPTLHPLVGEIPKDLPCFSNELQVLQQRLKRAITAHQQTPTTSRKRRDSCPQQQALVEGFNCASQTQLCSFYINQDSPLAQFTCFNAQTTCQEYTWNCVDVHID